MDTVEFVVIGDQALRLSSIWMVEWNRTAKADDDEAVTVSLDGEVSYSYTYQDAKELLRVVGLLT